MPYVVGHINGSNTANVYDDAGFDAGFDEAISMPNPFVIGYDMASTLDSNVQLEMQVFAKHSVLTPENCNVKMTWRDTYNDDVVLSISGKLSADEEDYTSIVNVALSTELFESFELNISDLFSDVIADFDGFNPSNTLGRKVGNFLLPLEKSAAISDQKLYEAVTEMETTPNYLVMFYKNDLQLFQTMLRVAEKLNIPLYVELEPTLLPEQAAQLAIDLSSYSHQVVILINAVLARPNNATSLRGKKKPRYGIGTLIGYTLLRNANLNPQGLAPIADPVAGYDFPMRWAGMEMRKDVKFGDDVLDMLAAAKVNVILAVKYDTGTRFVLNDCLTQYNSKTSVLRLASSAEISMAIDNRLIQICKRHLLKSKGNFKKMALRECQSFMESCATAGWIVYSEELQGKYTLDITDRIDRPHDALDLKANYRPEGCVRVVFLDTAVYK